MSSCRLFEPLDRLAEEFPLHIAVMCMVDSAKMIQQAMTGEPKPSIEHRDSYGRTPLQLAMAMNNIEAAKELIKFGADTTVEDEDGFGCKGYQC